MKFYDSSKKCLVYTREDVKPDYWDEHWNAENIQNIRERILGFGKHSFVARITNKYIDPNGGPILEGGCGLGCSVESLRLNGYTCIGIDNARKTVKVLQDNVPELDIRYGDVRKLDFPDNYFIGYWSIGVIEHFWDGYDDIANEMFRTIRPGGYLFLEVPYMSCYRKTKARLRLYEEVDNVDVATFYQFALNAKDVANHFEKLGFKMVKRKYREILYGIKDEFPSLGPIVDFILKQASRNIFTKASYFVLDGIISAVSGCIFGHTIVLVFRKNAVETGEVPPTVGG